MADDDDPGEREEDHEAQQRRFARNNPPGQPFVSWAPRFDDDHVVRADAAPYNTTRWRSVGPLNLAGRIRTLAMDPPDPAAAGPFVIYAGAASGGVFRTRDGGRSWQSVWPENQASLSIGAIAIGRSGGVSTLWVATGEKDKTKCSGVWRADIPADPAAPLVFARAGTVNDLTGGASPVPEGIEAAAVDPLDREHCWFVGPQGVYASRAGVWRQADLGRPYADVKFVRSGALRYVVLARANSDWGDLVIVPDPDTITSADLQTLLTNAAVGAGPNFVPGPGLAAPVLPALPPPAITSPPARRCNNARIVVVPNPPADRVYAVYTTTDGGNAPFHTFRVADTIQDDGAGNAQWATTRDWTARNLPGNTESQGDYNLFLAVSPANRNHVALGMLTVWATHDAGATWRHALDWPRYDTGDWGHHADQHAALFVPQAAGQPHLWIGNDGGVAVSPFFIDPATGAPPTTEARFRWRRRIHGLVISQAYDLAQHPLLPDVQTVALQDIGGWLTAGSTSWYHVQGGDGIGCSFDPTDPYRLISGWQGMDDTLRGLEEVRFAGNSVMNYGNGRYAVPAAAFPFAAPPAPRPPTRLMARQRGVATHRPLAAGMVTDDRATFDETLAHPTDPARLLHLRKRRAYYSENGEAWRVVDAGNRLEVFAKVSHEGNVASTLGGVVIDVSGTAAVKLGFLPGATSDLRWFAFANPPAVGARGDLERYRVRVINGKPGPYRLTAGDRLSLTIDVTIASAAIPNRFTTTVDVDFPDTRDYTLTEVVTRARAGLPDARAGVWVNGGGPNPLPADATVELHVLPTFQGSPTSVLVVTDAVGAAAEVTVGGTAAPAFRVQDRQYRGEAGRPAVVVLQAPAAEILPGIEAAAVPLAAADQLEITTARGDAANERRRAHAYPAPDYFDQYGPWCRRRLAATVAAGANPPPVQLWAITAKKYLRIWSGRARNAAYSTFTFPPDAASTARAGIADGDATVLAAPAMAFADLKPQRWARYDLRPGFGPGASSVLRIRVDGTDVDITFNDADFDGHLDNVTVEEARRVIEARFRAVAAAADLSVEVHHEYEADPLYDSPTEVAYSEIADDVMWLGATHGGVFASSDRGRTWSDFTLYDDEDLFWTPVEAIAPDRVAGVAALGALVGCSKGCFHVTAAGWEPRNAGLVRGPGYAEPGVPLVFALERGRGESQVYAATDVGVFVTEDNGRHWHPFHDGLPHVPAIDLAYEPSTRTLRVATWGRGVFERVLGDRIAPAPLYVRASDRDNGRRPAPHGPALGVDRPTSVNAFESPDIRITALPAADLDSVEVDELPAEPLIPDRAYTVVVRGHNGSTAAVADVRLIALWADASRALPDLTGPVWDGVAAGPVGAGPFNGWRLIGDGNVGAIASGSAAITTFAKTWTAAELAEVSQVAIVLIAAAGNAVVPNRPLDVSRLAVDEPRVALRLIEVQRGAPDAITLTAIGGARFMGLVVTGGADPFAFAGAPGARVTSNPGPFAVAGLTLTITIEEPLPAPVGPQNRALAIDFDETAFSAAPAPAIEVRAFLSRILARDNRQLAAVAPVAALALARSPGDRGPRVGGLAWAAAELVVTASATAATDDDFAMKALIVPATVPVAAERRFSVRVHNRGGADSAGGRLSFYAIDPRAATPALQPIHAGGKPLDPIPAGGSAIQFDVGTIPVISQQEVLLLAVLDQPADAAPAPADWEALFTLVGKTDRMILRTAKRA